MAHGYTSVAPGDSNDGWIGWMANIDPVVVLEFFNIFASQSGHMARCNRFTVANHRGHNSFTFDLVENYGFERKATITVTVTLNDDVRFRAFPFNPQSNDKELETRTWLCEAHAWTYQQFAGRNMFRLTATCPLLPDPVVSSCSPCFEVNGGVVPSNALTFRGEVLLFRGEILTFTP